MKKVIAMLFAALIMAFSAVPAFAEEVHSPTGVTVPDTEPVTSSTKKDDTPTSPKTGSSDVAAYSAIALSLAAAGAATLVFVKSKK